MLNIINNHHLTNLNLAFKVLNLIITLLFIAKIHHFINLRLEYFLLIKKNYFNDNFQCFSLLLYPLYIIFEYNINFI